MSEREILLKKITDEFARWEVALSHLNSMNLHDANVFSEDTMCALLNCIFNYKLKNLNLLKANHPAIDLGDEDGISFQVTSSGNTKKIQSTIDKFFEHKLHEKYNELFFLVLGKRQKSYPQFKVLSDYSFISDIHILDFRSLLNFIRVMPVNKLKRISNILIEEHSKPEKRKLTHSNAAKLKRKLSLKKRLQKDFLRVLDREEWEFARYEPWIRFTYHNVLIRSVDDKKWPEVDANPEKGKMSSWNKGEFWDFYDNGIELVWMGGDAIFDDKGNWDELDWKGDKRKEDRNYKVVPFWRFYRIPYEYIVDYDMETDEYHGLPSIYVEYAKNGMPYEEIIYGQPGIYKQRKYTWYFNNKKRKKLK